MFLVFFNTTFTGKHASYNTVGCKKDGGGVTRWGNGGEVIHLMSICELAVKFYQILFICGQPNWGEGGGSCGGWTEEHNKWLCFTL